MKILRAEFRNHQLWNLDAPAQQPERLVFRDGSEVAITLHDAAYLLRPNLAALSLSLNLRAAGASAAQPGLRGATAAKIGYKIYVLANTAGVQYVGCTRTGMSSRIRMGHMRSKTPKNGYHGYKWLTQPSLQLYVFTLPQELLALATASQISHSILAERIEAELVYAVRAATGHWPLSLHEIHFHNLTTQPEAGTLTTSIAQAMYAQLGQPKQLLVP